MDNILRLIGLAKRAGRLEIGEEPVGEACRARACRLLLVARDAAGNTLRRARRFAEAGRCVWLSLPWGKDELGSAVGRASCAVAAVTDIGLAAAIAEKLAAAEPETYGPAAEKLSAKAEKAVRRRREQTDRRRDGGARKPYVPTRVKRGLKQSR